MSNDSVAVLRSVVIYAICLPLAIFLGYMLTDPLDKSNDIYLGILLFLLVLPLLLRWYHPWLIAMWNSAVVFYFLPGLLSGWMLMACLGFAVALGHYILNREREFLTAPSVAWSLVFLTVVVAATAKLRGGIGLHMFGDETIGGKRYFYIWFAVVGYFAMTSQAIPPKKRNLYTFLFVGCGMTAALSDLGDLLGGPFHFLFLLFPPGDSSYLANHSASGAETIVRFGGLGLAGAALALTLVARYGMEGVLDLKKLWRLVLFVCGLILVTFGGFRSLVILVGITLVLMFCFEGLLRSRLMPIAMLGVLLCGTLTLAFSDRLPLTFQRCIAFVPGVKISALARENAEASSNWRIDMWKSLLPQIPKYLLLGKGLGIDANDLWEYYQFGNNEVQGEVGGGLAAAGDYHSGPLTVIIPFGIWGVIAFLWFLVASFKVLWANYKYGDPDIRRTNSFLLSYFAAKTILFFFVFGGFYSDMMMFAGLVGFSIALNGGVAKKPAPVTRPRVVFNRFRPLPAQSPAPAG